MWRLLTLHNTKPLDLRNRRISITQRCKFFSGVMSRGRLNFIDKLLIAWCSAATFCKKKTLEVLLQFIAREITFFMWKMFPLNIFSKLFDFFLQIFAEKSKVNKIAFFPCSFQVFSQTLRPLSSLQRPSNCAMPLWGYWQRGCHWMEHVADVREGKKQWCGLTSSPWLIWKLWK